jgi:hypothetical protein
MKLHGTIGIKVDGEPVLRTPGFWDKAKAIFGGTPDLRTGRIRAALEAATLVEASRQALARLGVTNAISLVIDKHVIFEDRDGRPDDLGDLMFAFRDNAVVFGANFELLRLVVEHEEAGLHTVIEVMARSEHPANETAARVVMGGRVSEFEPRAGESAEAYRQRIEPLMRTPAVFEAHRVQFESFVGRVADTLRGVLPDAEVEINEANANVEKPTEAPRPAISPTDRRYDPYDVYYPSPFPGLFTAMMWGSILSWGMMPHYTVINHVGDPVGAIDDMSHDDLAAVADGEDVGSDFDGGGDLGGGDYGDGDYSGGDFGDGGFDGGDMGGGFDLGGGFDFGDW